MVKEISNGLGQPVGRLVYSGNDERSSGVAYTRVGKMVGRYDHSSDMTYDNTNKPFGKGNLLEAVVRCHQ